MKRKTYSYQELDEIAVELVKSLKPKGLMIGELRHVFEKAITLLDNITYGEPPQEVNSEENT